MKKWSKVRLLVLGATILGAISLVAASPALAQPTRDQYIAQADPICAATNQAEARALRGVLSDLRHLRWKQAAGKLRQANVLFSSGIEQIAALEPPPPDSSLIAAWVESLRAQVPIVNRWAGALSRFQVGRAVRLAKQAVQAGMRSWAIVEDYGFQACNRF
jgi:hypothetical protein